MRLRAPAVERSACWRAPLLGTGLLGFPLGGQFSAGCPPNPLEQQAPQWFMFQRVLGARLDAAMTEHAHADFALAESPCPEHRPLLALKHGYAKRLQISLRLQIVIKFVLMLAIGHASDDRMAR